MMLIAIKTVTLVTADTGQYAIWGRCYFTVYEY